MQKKVTFRETEGHFLQKFLLKRWTGFNLSSERNQ